jgi:8-oxo-dGTP pyrophosphatase MutT (NUDIX family)
MYRNNLKNLLQNYHPSDPQEKIFKQRMLDFLDQYPNCFERSLEIGHFTASCWLLNDAQTHALLMHHAKLNRWFQLGGHADGQTDLLAVAIKEAQEESGILNIVPVSVEIFDIDIHQIPANSREKEHEHFDVRFLLKVLGDEEVIQNRESKELRWIGKNRSELPTDSRSVVRMFDKWVAKK